MPRVAVVADLEVERLRRAVLRAVLTGTAHLHFGYAGGGPYLRCTVWVPEKLTRTPLCRTRRCIRLHEPTAGRQGKLDLEKP